MPKPGMIVTGAAGFVGSRLVKRLSQQYQIFAIDRRSPEEVGAIEGPGIHWFQIDIGCFDSLREAFDRIKEMGRVETLLHLGSYYDFSGEDHPEYTHTNVTGTRNLLELSAPLRLKKFFFTSSVAACSFPKKGKAVTEDSPPSAPVPYARSKRMGEEMLREYRDRIPLCILRLTAIFNDWSEYELLTHFLATRLSNKWNSRILGGKGLSAVPYLHIQDLVSFYIRAVEKCDALEALEVLQASPNGCTTHLKLYQAATRSFYGSARLAVHIPKLMARPGMMMREKLERISGNTPFERAWMGDYIDLQLKVDASRTHRRLDWTPDAKLHILERMPIIVHNMQNNPEKWKLLRAQQQKIRLEIRD